jgi:hypothetical protein
MKIWIVVVQHCDSRGLEAWPVTSEPNIKALARDEADLNAVWPKSNDPFSPFFRNALKNEFVMAFGPFGISEAGVVDAEESSDGYATIEEGTE